MPSNPQSVYFILIYIILEEDAYRTNPLYINMQIYQISPLQLRDPFSLLAVYKTNKLGNIGEKEEQQKIYQEKQLKQQKQSPKITCSNFYSCS